MSTYNPKKKGGRKPGGPGLKDPPELTEIFTEAIKGKSVDTSGLRNTYALTKEEKKVLRGKVTAYYDRHGIPYDNTTASNKVRLKLMTLAGGMILTGAAKEAKNKSLRVANLTPAQKKRKKEQSLMANMSEYAQEQKRKRCRIENWEDGKLEHVYGQQAVLREQKRNRLAAAAARARPSSDTDVIMIDFPDEATKNRLSKAETVIQELGPKTYVHLTPVLMEDLLKPTGRKFENDEECTLYSHADLVAGVPHEDLPPHLRDWKPTSSHTEPHHDVYATPVMSVALHHSRKAIKKGQTLDLHCIHPGHTGENNPVWDKFRQVYSFSSSAMFVKCADQVPSQAIYRGTHIGNGEYEWPRIWMRDPDGPFKDLPFLP